MSTTWKISHAFSCPIPYQSPPTSYPSLGISWDADSTNLLAINHELVVDDTVSNKGEIVDLSTRYVAVFLELLRYRSGFCEVERQSVHQVHQDPTHRPSLTNFARISGQASIVRAFEFPPETSILSVPPRLRVWLRLATDARPPTSSADAIRNYYMIWEDMELDSGSGTLGEELRFIRNFVSHGNLLKDQPLLRFLARELGKPTQQYDPHHPDHQIFLDRRREWARRLVESEIDKKL